MVAIDVRMRTSEQTFLGADALDVGKMVAVTGCAVNRRAAWSPPLALFALLSAATFLLLLVLFLRHNQSPYKHRYSLWARSLLCQRCGTLTEQA
jgi:hypothetical protein